MSDAEECISMTRTLPEEVVIGILSQLPVKPLMRFRCVSKTWLHWMCSDSRFIKLHLDRSKRKNAGIIVSGAQGHEGLPQFYYAEDCTSSDDAICFETPFHCHSFRLVDVCNGLVCLVDMYDNVYVWNPLTRDHIIISSPPLPSQFCTDMGDGIRDRETEVLYGFGFHQGSNEYKVLRLVSISVFESRYFETDVSVYTLGTDSWRSLGDIMDYNINLGQSGTALVNGALHWFAPKGRPSVIFNVLVAFDLQGEYFREIPQPQYVKIDGAASTVADEEEGDYIRYSVGEFSGLLGIFRSVGDKKIEIWMMKEYGVVDSWSKQYIVNGSKIPVGVTNNEEIVLLENDDDRRLILYNSKTNSTRNLNNFGFPVYDASNYSGSLLSPTLINNSKHSSV